MPASVLAQAIRGPERQVRLSRFIRQPTTDVIDLGRVDATTRRPDVRAARIAEVVDLLAAGIKERPRS